VYVIIELFMNGGGGIYDIIIDVAKFGVWVWDSYVSFGGVR
jgi:hypothetical protein